MKSRKGIRKCLCWAHVISYILLVTSRAVWTLPPTHDTMAGAAAIANPPKPAVSVIELSPRSGFASAS